MDVLTENEEDFTQDGYLLYLDSTSIFGNRNWSSCYATISNDMFIVSKDEKSVQHGDYLFEIDTSTIQYVERDNGGSGKQNVFKIKTRFENKEFYFSCYSPVDSIIWITTLEKYILTSKKDDKYDIEDEGFVDTDAGVEILNEVTEDGYLKVIQKSTCDFMLTLHFESTNEKLTVNKLATCHDILKSVCPTRSRNKHDGVNSCRTCCLRKLYCVNTHGQIVIIGRSETIYHYFKAKCRFYITSTAKKLLVVHFLDDTFATIFVDKDVTSKKVVEMVNSMNDIYQKNTEDLRLFFRNDTSTLFCDDDDNPLSYIYNERYEPSSKNGKILVMSLEYLNSDISSVMKNYTSDSKFARNNEMMKDLSIFPNEVNPSTSSCSKSNTTTLDSGINFPPLVSCDVEQNIREDIVSKRHDILVTHMIKRDKLVRKGSFTKKQSSPDTQNLSNVDKEKNNNSSYGSQIGPYDGDNETNIEIRNEKGETNTSLPYDFMCHECVMATNERPLGIKTKEQLISIMREEIPTNNYLCLSGVHLRYDERKNKWITENETLALYDGDNDNDIVLNNGDLLFIWDNGDGVRSPHWIVKRRRSDKVASNGAIENNNVRTKTKNNNNDDKINKEPKIKLSKRRNGATLKHLSLPKLPSFVEEEDNKQNNGKLRNNKENIKGPLKIEDITNEFIDPIKKAVRDIWNHFEYSNDKTRNIGDDIETPVIGWLVSGPLCQIIAKLLCHRAAKQQSLLKTMFGDRLTVWTLVCDFTLAFEIEEFSQIITFVSANKILSSDEMKFRFFICELLNRKSIRGYNKPTVSRPPDIFHSIDKANRFKSSDEFDSSRPITFVTDPNSLDKTNTSKSLDKPLIKWFRCFERQENKLEQYYEENSFLRMRQTRSDLFDEIIQAMMLLNGKEFHLHSFFESQLS